MTKPLPAEILERRAAEQRRLLHASVLQLRAAVVGDVKEKFDVTNAVHRHFWTAAGVLSVTGFALGYGLAGIFSD